MTLRIRDWKKYARMAMQGNLGILAAGMFMTTMASMIANSVTNMFFSGSGIYTFILAECFTFIVSLILNILIAGNELMNLKVAREEKAGIQDVVYYFRFGSDRVIIAGLVRAVLQFLSSVPMIIYNYTAEIGTTQEEILQWEIRFLMLMLVAMTLQVLFTIPFSLSYYLLADYPEMTGIEAVKQSMKMMKGHMGKYLLMELSFLPWIIGSAFTFYLALIWVLPYMNLVKAEFYRDVHGEFVVQSAYHELVMELPDENRELDIEETTTSSETFDSEQ